MSFSSGRSTLRRYPWPVLVAVMLLVMGCAQDEEPARPAPIGDKAVLQHLAEAYEKVAEDLPVSPWMLAPKERKQFVKDLFAKAGYSYAATLQEMAASKWDVADQNTLDLIQLLLLPHANLAPSARLEGVYTPQEAAAIRAIRERMRR